MFKGHFQGVQLDYGYLPAAWMMAMMRNVRRQSCCPCGVTCGSVSKFNEGSLHSSIEKY